MTKKATQKRTPRRKKSNFKLDANARLTHRYIEHMKHAFQLSEVSIRQSLRAVDDLGQFLKEKDFRAITLQDILGYKDDLRTRVSIKTGERLSLSSVQGRLQLLSKMFSWLRDQRGYRTYLTADHVAYFKLARPDARRANGRKRKPVPTPDQIRKALTCTPTDTEKGLRDKAFFAALYLTGARIDAVVSLRLKHIDLISLEVFQDGSEVRTKGRKDILTPLFPVGDDIVEILVDWIRFLRDVKKFGPDDPLFPAMESHYNPESRIMEIGGLSKSALGYPSMIYPALKEAWERAGLPYFNPHSIRKTLTRLGERLCKTPEEFKAWSQALGHEDVSTTFKSYGEVSDERQSIVFSKLRKRFNRGDWDDDDFD